MRGHLPPSQRHCPHLRRPRPVRRENGKNQQFWPLRYAFCPLNAPLPQKQKKNLVPPLYKTHPLRSPLKTSKGVLVKHEDNERVPCNNHRNWKQHLNVWTQPVPPQQLCLSSMTCNRGWNKAGPKANCPHNLVRDQLPSKFDDSPQNIKTKGPNGPWKCWLILIADVFKDIRENKSDPTKNLRVLNFLYEGAQIVLQIFGLFRPLTCYIANLQLDWLTFDLFFTTL